jgi:hypothetical protein
VTLAAAFVLPVDTQHREVLILVALVVVGATLLIQGATLPWVLRHLGLKGPDPAEDALQAASVQQQAAAAGMARLDELVTDDVGADVVDRLRRRSTERSDALWERLGGGDETPSEAYGRLRVEMIAAERAELIRLRDSGHVPDEVMRRVISGIDIEETVLDLAQSWNGEARQSELTAPRTHGGCEHIRRVEAAPPPRTPGRCQACVDEGLPWVHLRMCVTCGEVGCCDSSIGKHATAHFDQTTHPVMRSIEPGEAWSWCYVDTVLG